MKTTTDYVREAYEKYCYVEYSVKGGADNPYRSPTWDFIRCLKAALPFRDLEAVDALTVVDDDFVEIGCRWTDFSTDWSDDDDGRTAFLAEWGNIKFAEGEEPLSQSRRKAKEHPLRFKKRYPSPFVRVMSLAYHLQMTMGDSAIFLPVREVGKVLGIPPKTVSNVTVTARKDGFLELVKRHNRAQNLAAEFRVKIDKLLASAEVM